MKNFENSSREINKNISTPGHKNDTLKLLKNLEDNKVKSTFFDEKSQTCNNIAFNEAMMHDKDKKSHYFMFSNKDCMKTSRTVNSKVYHPETGQILISKHHSKEKSYKLSPLHILLLIGGPESLVDIERQIIQSESDLIAPNGKSALMMVASGVLSYNLNTDIFATKRLNPINNDSFSINTTSIINHCPLLNHVDDLNSLYLNPKTMKNDYNYQCFQSHAKRSKMESNGVQSSSSSISSSGSDVDKAEECRALERKIILHLFAIGSNPELQNPFTGETAAHYAVKHDRADLLRLFLTRGISSWSTDFFGNNLLHTALNWNSSKCFDLILSLFIGEIDATDFYYGETALIKSISMMMSKEAKTLISGGSSLAITDNRGRNCLHWAAIMGNDELVDILTENGMPSNILDKSNYTPLVYACIEGHLECVKILVNRGAKIFVCDSQNRMTWEIADISGFTEIADYLRQAVGNDDHDNIIDHNPFNCMPYRPANAMISNTASKNDKKFENIMFDTLTSTSKYYHWPIGPFEYQSNNDSHDTTMHHDIKNRIDTKNTSINNNSQHNYDKSTDLHENQNPTICREINYDSIDGFNSRFNDDDVVLKANDSPCDQKLINMTQTNSNSLNIPINSFTMDLSYDGNGSHAINQLFDNTAINDQNQENNDQFDIDYQNFVAPGNMTNYYSLIDLPISCGYANEPSIIANNQNMHHEYHENVQDKQYNGQNLVANNNKFDESFEIVNNSHKIFDDTVNKPFATSQQLYGNLQTFLNGNGSGDGIFPIVDQ